MGMSTLDPDNIDITAGSRPDRSLGRGHGTGALGPGDTSDSGSDVMGANGMAQDTGSEMPLDDNGNTSQAEHGGGTGAGPDLGDPRLESDTDSNGTGERGAAGRDAVTPTGADIGYDRVVREGEVVVVEEEDLGMDDKTPRKQP